MPKFDYTIWRGYRPAIRSTAEGFIGMPNYDPNQFAPRPTWNPATGKWEDPNRANRTVNRRAQVEAEIDERKRRGYNLSDIALQPHAIPKGAAGPEKYQSPEEHRKAQLTYQSVQGAIGASAGKQPEVEALRRSDLLAATKAGQISLQTAGRASMITESMRQGGKRTQATHEKQLRNLSNEPSTTPFTIVPQNKLPTRESLLKAMAVAKPQVEALQSQTQKNASALMGSQVPMSAVHQIMPQLSHEQLAGVQSQNQYVGFTGGPGGGKSKAATAAAFSHLINQGLSTEEVQKLAKSTMLVSQTKSAVKRMELNLQGAENVIPGWSADQRAKQLKTIPSYGMSLLTRGQKGGNSILQQMGLGHYQPLYQGAGENIEEEMAKREHEQVLRRVLVAQGYNTRINNVNQLSQTISEIKGTSKETFDVAYKRGKDLHDQNSQRQAIPAEQALYYYQNELHKNKQYDINDVPRMLLSASQHKNVQFPRVGMIVNDESQDTAPIWGQVFQKLLGPSGKLITAGDPSQQAIRRPWDISQTIARAGGQNFPLQINFRTGPRNVASLNPLLATQAMADQPKSPFQGAFKEHDLHVQTHVEENFPAMHRKMFSNWMKDMGLTPQMIAQNMQTGVPAFSSPDAGHMLPGDAPFIFQRDEEGIGAFQREMRSTLGKHMNEQLLDQFMRENVTSEPPDPSNMHMVRTYTVGKARSHEFDTIHGDVTPQGLWDEASRTGQLYTMQSRAINQQHLYASMKNASKGTQHDLSTSFFGGQQVPGGWDQLMQAWVENMVDQQGMNVADLPEALQYAYNSPHAMNLETSPDRPSEDPEMVKKFIEATLFTNKFYSPAVSSGTGIQSGSQDEQMGAGMRSLGMNAEMVSGQTKRGVISQSKMEMAGRMAENMIMGGPGEVTHGQASLYQGGVYNLDATRHQLTATTTRKELVPSPSEFMDQIHQMAGPIPAHLMQDPIEREASSEFPEIDNTQMKPWAGENQSHEAGDTTQVRQWMSHALAVPGFRNAPEITGKLNDLLTHPKVLETIREPLKKLAANDPKLTKLQERVHLGQMDGHEAKKIQGTIAKLTSMQKAASDRQEQVKTLQESIQELTPEQQAQLDRLQSTTSKFTPAHQKQLEHLQNKMKKIGAEPLHRIISRMTTPNLTGTNKPNPLYHEGFTDLLHGAAAKQLPWTHLDPDFVGFLGQRARTFEREGDPSKSRFWNEAAGKFEAYGISVHPDGAPVTKDILSHAAPHERALLERIFENEHGGDILPYNHPDVQSRMNQFTYQRGLVNRGMVSKENLAAMKLSPGNSRRAPAETEFANLYMATQEGGAGIEDPMNTLSQGGGRFASLGAGTRLDSMIQRLKELSHPDRKMTKLKRAGFAEQLGQAQYVRSELGDPKNWRNWGQTMQAVMRASTGEGVADTTPIEEGKPNDPIRRFFRHRDQVVPHARSLKSLTDLISPLKAASEHLQKTGSLRRSHLDDVLKAFGYDPADKSLIALRKLEEKKGFSRQGGQDPELPLAKLIGQFPGQEKELHEQLTRVPVVQGERYTYMGGQPGYADIKMAQAGIPAGISGSLYPLPKTKGVGSEKEFGLSKTIQTHMAHKMLSKSDLATINPEKAKRLPDTIANQQYAPLMQFVGMNKGKLVRFPVHPDQLALADTAGQERGKGFEDLFKRAKWTGLRWKEQDQNKKQIEVLRRSAEAKRKHDRPWFTPKQLANPRGYASSFGVDPRELPVSHRSYKGGPFSSASNTLQQAQATQHSQGQVAHQLVGMQQPAPEPMQSYRGYQLGGDLNETAIDSIIKGQQKKELETNLPESPEFGPVDPNLQPMLPGFGGSGGNLPPTPPAPPTPEPEDNPSRQFAALSSPEMERAGPSSVSSHLQQKMLVQHARDLSQARDRKNDPLLASLGTIPGKKESFPGIADTQQSPASATKGSWDEDPYGFPAEPPPQDNFSPTKEEMLDIHKALSQIDEPSMSKQASAAIAPAPLPPQQKSAPAPQASKYHLANLPKLMRSQSRSLIRGGRVHPFEAGKPGIGVGGTNPEQRDVLNTTDPRMIVQGGPGTGKTETMIMKIADLIAKGQISPSKVMAFSGMHSGVSELNTRLNTFLQPLLPSGDEHQVPAARTLHSLAYQTLFQRGKPSPHLQDAGLGWIKGVMGNPSEEELAHQTPETQALMRDQQRKFLHGSIKQSFPKAKWTPNTNEDLDEVLKSIKNYKTNRGGDKPLYDEMMTKGTGDIASGAKFTHAGAFAAYEQGIKQTGNIDFEDLITHGSHALAKLGGDAVPQGLEGTQLLAYDEAQDANRENLGFVSNLTKAIGPQTHAIVGLDPLQALFQGAGSLPSEQIIPEVQAMLGGATHHQLRGNYRSSKRDVALSNAILQMHAMKSKKGLSPLQVPYSQKLGSDPAFMLTKSQPMLYKKMFGSMLAQTGVSPKAIRENILAGEHPFKGVDWNEQGKTRPGEIPALFMMKAQRELFEHLAPSTLEGLDPSGGISPEMAHTAFGQMYRRGLPGKAASDEEQAGFNEKLSFRGLTTGQSRGLSFENPHMDVTPVGEWRRPGKQESYLHNLGVMVSRVKEGGRNFIGAASTPFSGNQMKDFVQTQGSQYRETVPQSHTSGSVWYGDTSSNPLEVHARNTFDTHEAQPVPHYFGEIMGLQSKQVADWQTMAVSPKEARIRVAKNESVIGPRISAAAFAASPTGKQVLTQQMPKSLPSPSPSSSPLPLSSTSGIDSQYHLMINQLHEEYAKLPVPKSWSDFMQKKVPEIEKLASSPTSNVLQFAKQMAANPDKFAPGAAAIPAKDVTINTQANSKVTVAGGAQVDIVKASTPKPASMAGGAPVALDEMEDLPLSGSTPVTRIHRNPFAAQGQSSAGPMTVSQVLGTSPPGSGGGDKEPPKTTLAKLSGGATNTGRTFARIGMEMQYFGKMFDDVTQKAIEQGSDYRLASGTFKASGATADRGFYDFANPSSGISQIQSNKLPMYSKTEIAQNLQAVAGMTGGQTPPTGTSTSIMQLAALTGMDPTQLTSQMGSISGSMGRGMTATPAIEGYTGSLYHGQVNATNLAPTMQAVSSALPSMQGLTFGKGNNLGAFYGLMNAAQGGGMTAANMPDVADLSNSLAQIGTSPNLNQQAALSQLFPGQLTGGVQLAQFQQQQVGMNEQAAQLGLQQQFNLPQMQMQIDNANVAMQQANIDLSQIQHQQGEAQLGLTQQQLGESQASLNYQRDQHAYQQSSLDYQKQQLKYSEAQLGYSQQQFQYSQAQYGQAQLQHQYGQASFNQQQYVQEKQYGPIGGNTGRSSYFDFMRNQQAAGYNPLSAETGTQFKPSAPQGIQNMQFYAGIENQRQMSILSRSPLLSDAAFQQQQKYLNEQEAFYKEQLDLTNEQRQFDKDWGQKMLDSQQKLLDMQGPLLNTQKKLLDMQQPMLDTQKSLLSQQQSLLNTSGHLLDLQQGILDTQKGMLIYTQEELDAQGKILGIQQTQVDLANKMNAYQEAQLKLQEAYLPAELAALQAVQTAMQQSISGQGPINGKNPTPQQIIQKLSLVQDPKQQQDIMRNLGLAPKDVNTLQTILNGMKKEGGYDAAMNGVSPADRSIQKQVNDLVKSGAFASQTNQAASSDTSLLLGGTGAQWTKFVDKFTQANKWAEQTANAASSINDYIKGWGTFFTMAGPALVGIGMVLQGLGIGGSIAGFITGGGAAAAASGAAGWVTGTAAPAVGTAISGAATATASTISAAITTAAPIIIPLVIAAAGTAIMTFALKWLGDQASTINQKNFNNPKDATQNLPSWLQWLPGKTASPQVVASAQKKQDDYRASHGGKDMPMSDTSPLAKGTLLGDAWGGIQSGAKSAWSWLTTPIWGDNKAEAAPAPAHPKGHDFGAQKYPKMPNVGSDPHGRPPDSNTQQQVAIKAGWDKFWADRGGDWNKFWTAAGKNISGVFAPVGKFFNKLSDGYSTLNANIHTFITKTVPAWFMEYMFNPVTKFFGNLSSGYAKLNASAHDFITKTLPTWFVVYIFNPVGKFFSNVSDGYAKINTKLHDFVTKTLPTLFMDYVFNPVANFFVKTLPQAAGGAWDWIKRRGSDAWDWVKTKAADTWNGMINQVSNWFNPSSKNNIGTLLGNALKSIDWGKIFNLGKFFGGGALGGGGGEPAGHPGFVTPHVNTEFGAQMWYGKHQGVDFSAPQGSALREFVGGTVSNTGHYAWGGEVDVKVPGGLTERYLHLSGIAVRPGQRVARGQPIGLTGGGTLESGLGYWSSGSHLHAQFDRGDYQGGINPWPVWRGFGDLNISQNIGGSFPGMSTLTGHFATGAVVMKPIMAQIAEREPEAVLPLSKLSDVLKSLPKSSGSAIQPTTTASGQRIEIKSLIGSATIIVNTNGTKIADTEKDELMSQLMDLLGDALKQLNK